MATQFSSAEGRPWKGKFFTIWGGQATSIFGSQLVQFALIWYLTVATESATVLAIASMVGMLPSVVLGPIVGTLVDRWNRRWIMVAADGLIAAATLVLALLFYKDGAEIWHIYVVMFIRSLATAFHGNAMTASTSLMVPVEHLARVQGINQMLNGGLNVVSAPVGALLLAVLPVQGILAIDVLTALVAIIPLLFIDIPLPERLSRREAVQSAAASLFDDFKEGLGYILAWPGLLIVSGIAVGINFVISPAFALIPLLVKSHFGGGALELGWVESAFGLGVIIGGAALGAWGGFQRKIVTSMAGLIGLALGAMLIGLAPPNLLVMAIAGGLMIGLMLPLINGPIVAVIQSCVQADMQARVLSIFTSLCTGMAPLGLALAGPLADQIGTQGWFLIAAGLCLTMGIFGLLNPAVMNIEEHGNGAIAEALPAVAGPATAYEVADKVD